MAPLVGPHNDKYADFYSSWIRTQESLLNDLQRAIDSDMKESELAQQVQKVADHYDVYYKAKQSAYHQDVLQAVIPDWKSPLEKAFLWLGGWRPSLAFQLVYALAGQLIEVELAEFLEGVDSPSFASLTASQLSQISDLQVSTNKQEEHLSSEMAILQQSFADQPLLSLAQAHHLVQVKEAKNVSHIGTGQEADPAHKEGRGDDDQGTGASEEESESGVGMDDVLDTAMQEKLNALQGIAAEADALRLSTLKKVLSVLDTFQKAQYLLAAGKLQIAVRNIGEKLTGITAP